MKNLHGCGDAGEFSGGVAHIDHQAGEDQKKCGAKSEFFADQIRKALAGDYAHARAHLFRDVERDGHRNQRPQQRVAELRAGLRVNGNSARVVVDVRGDDARPEDREKYQKPASQDTRAFAELRATLAPDFYPLVDGRQVHSFRRSRVTTSSTAIAPIGRPMSSITARLRRLYLSNKSNTSFSFASGGTETSGSVFISAMR